MNLFVLGVRRSGTTILYDVLSQDPELRCFYEPLREDAPSVGGGSGARAEDVFAETRAIREAFRAERFPELPVEHFNCGGPRTPEAELDPELSRACAELLAHLLEQAPQVVIKETRLHHKLEAIAAIDPNAAIVHVVRDPRAVTASMLLGRRRRTDIYPDAETFFTARTGRRLWSSRRISEELLASGRVPGPRSDIPDFLRALAVWKAAVERAGVDGARLFGARFATTRLEDLRADPRTELERVYALLDCRPPPAVLDWASAMLRGDDSLHLGEDPRWARAARLLEMEPQLRATGYEEILELDPSDTELDLTPPPPRSRLAGLVGRARGLVER